VKVSIFRILLQDGLVNGAIYAMLAMEIVLTFSVGPNGAGKSTTFNLLTEVLRLSDGRIAHTFRHVKFVNDMSVVDNVAPGADRLLA
jgi:ABC-type branched-subunit amino acid transport system ATPase component